MFSLLDKVLKILHYGMVLLFFCTCEFVFMVSSDHNHKNVKYSLKCFDLVYLVCLSRPNAFFWVQISCEPCVNICALKM